VALLFQSRVSVALGMASSASRSTVNAAAAQLAKNPPLHSEPLNECYGLLATVIWKSVFLGRTVLPWMNRRNLADSCNTGP
jgi:hypothetical protein